MCLHSSLSNNTHLNNTLPKTKGETFVKEKGGQKISNKNLPFKETEIVIPCENAIDNEECKHMNDNSLKDQISVKESSMNANVSEANTDISNYTDVKSTTADSGHKIADSQDTVNLDLKDTSN